MTEEDWFVTQSGERMCVSSPDVARIHIGDIAHALSLICRFGGHTRSFYSVASHSVHVSDLVSPEHALAALLHDATEAYLGDVIRPLKRSLDAYARLEASWAAVIARRFGLPEDLPPEVKHADRVALVTERRDFITPLRDRWNWVWLDEEEGIVPDPKRHLKTVSPSEASRKFLDRFSDLGGT